MDFYEIYWWFALGTTCSLWNIMRIIEAKQSQVSTPDSNPDHSRQQVVVH
jgi:hypothetical protein